MQKRQNEGDEILCNNTSGSPRNPRNSHELNAVTGGLFLISLHGTSNEEEWQKWICI